MKQKKNMRTMRRFLKNLFSHPFSIGFLDGLASPAIMWSIHKRTYARPKYTDHQVIAKTWEAVGNDMNKAFSGFNKNHIDR